MNIETIYLDLHGVLLDFHNSARIANGALPLTPSEWRRDFPAKPCPETLGFNSKKAEDLKRFWEPINRHDRFWEEIAPYPWSQSLVRGLRDRFRDVRIVTGPASGTSREVSAMIDLCLRLGFVSDPTHVIPCKEKWRLSQPHTVLIDDWERQIEEFEKRGCGLGLLFPAPWNIAYHKTEDSAGYILHLLDQANPSTRRTLDVID